MSDVIVQVHRDAGEDVLLQISGSVTSGATKKVPVYKMAGETKALRIDAVMYALEDGVSARLLWEGPQPLPILPLSGRGLIPCAQFGSLHCPKEKGLTGSILLEVRSTTSEERHFAISLDLSKQRS